MQKAAQAVSLKLPNVTHMSSNHLHSQVSHQVTFCFIKNNNKIPSNPKHSSPLAQQSLQASARKSHIKLGTLKLQLLCSLGTSPKERKGLLQTSHRTASVPVAQPTIPCMCLCESHSTSRVAVLEPALPSCLHCLPEASAPALPSHHSWQAESKQKRQPELDQQLSPPPSGTITPLHPSSQHHPQPQVQARLSHPLASSQ